MNIIEMDTKKRKHNFRNYGGYECIQITSLRNRMSYHCIFLLGTATV